MVVLNRICGKRWSFSRSPPDDKGPITDRLALADRVCIGSCRSNCRLELPLAAGSLRWDSMYFCHDCYRLVNFINVRGPLRTRPLVQIQHGTFRLEATMADG